MEFLIVLALVVWLCVKLFGPRGDGFNSPHRPMSGPR